MKVIKVNLRREDGRALRAFADLELDPPDFIFRDFRVVRTRSGKEIVLAPQASIKERGKDPYYKTLIIPSVHMRRIIEQLVLDAYHVALDRSKEERNGKNSIPQT